MNTEHNDIQKVLPFGENLRGFANQKFITPSELQRILKERGIFTLTSNKDFTVPLLQTLLLSPREFDKIREAFSTKEDNKKVISRDINWDKDAKIFDPTLVTIEVAEFVKKNLPTCSLEKPIRLVAVDGNQNHLKAEFTIKRNDINKCWYEQTNLFDGAIEFIKEDDGKGRVIISHTAPETKALGEYAATQQVNSYKAKNIIAAAEKLRKIVFKDFSNEDRFTFFFRLTNHLDCEYFTCQTIKDISIKPEDATLPQEIKWMEELNKILLSGKDLDKKEFVKNRIYHSHLILWSLEAAYTYNYKGQIGSFTVSFGFPDYPTKKDNSEFELFIASISPTGSIDTKMRKRLKSNLLYEMDRQKSIVYNKFLEYKKTKEK